MLFANPPKLSLKSNCSSMLRQSRKFAPQTCSAALLPKAVLQGCCPKTGILQTCSPKRQSHSGKRLPKVTPQNWYRKLLSEVICKAAPESCSPKLFFKAIVRQSCSGKLAKAVLPKAVPRSCFPKLFPKAPLQSGCPKAAMLQTCSPKQLPKAIYSPKRLPKGGPQSCY